MNKKGIFLAIIAAVFYALSAPCSKFLLSGVPPTILAGLLYIGAGIGMTIVYFFSHKKQSSPEHSVTRKDTKYLVGMVILDIAAPICLLIGLNTTSASSVSLLNNFEIVATAIIAFTLFKEKITKKLWGAIILVTVSSILLSLNDFGSLTNMNEPLFSYGSLFVIVACICWGFENNCTRSLSSKNPVQIVMIKGLCSGTGSLIIGLIIGERITPSNLQMISFFNKWSSLSDLVKLLLIILLVILLGFIAYGLSICFYIYAQRYLGAAKTSAYYACAPFVGAVISMLLLSEIPTFLFCIAAVIMLVGSILAAKE